MASVRIHKNSSFWYACITGPDKRQRQFSTGLTDKAEAIAVATAAERALKHHGSIPHRLRESLDRIAADFIPSTDTDPGPWLIAWAESRRHECAPSTHNVYANVAKEAAAWLAEHRVSTFAGLTPPRVAELRAWWLGKNYASTANSKIKVLRIALKVALAEKRIDSNPADGLMKLREAKTRRREFRAPELEVLLPTLSGEWRGMVFLGLNTGQRLNDLAGLKWSQLDLAAATITFRTAKTDSLVCLPLLAASADALAEMPTSDDPSAPVFPKLAKLSHTARSNQFRAILAACGLADPVRHAKKDAESAREVSELSFHSLRHTTTSRLKSAGVSDSIARAIVGHASVAVSAAYTHLDMATMRAAMEKMPGLPI